MRELLRAVDAIASAGGPFAAVGLVRFNDPWWLLALLGLLPMIAVQLRERRRAPRLLTSVVAELQMMPTTFRAALVGVPRALYAIAFALGAIALARPDLPGRPSPLDAEGIDIGLVLDVSTSMNAADFSPKDRINVAKETIADFIRQRDSDRIALVVFAAEAFSQVPLTLDYDLLHGVLEKVQTGVITDGTAIGDALATGLNRVRSGTARSKVLILVTDGDNNAGAVPPIEAAQMAKQLGVQVFTILVGRGGRVPYPVGRNLLGQMQYEMKEIATNPDLLREIARITGGKFYTATDREALRGSFQDILSRMDKTRLEDQARYARRVEAASLLLWPAAIALCLGLVLAETRLRRFP
ncbi:MAG: VWA domain-containing protein [Deltaproteobacteria bacterium]|nr:VWA domain-containing protein [Deltaproteobacteria bacterium]